jgi:hypothetical protein
MSASSWQVVATCAACGRSMQGSGSAVLTRRGRFRPSNVWLSVLAERWPEPGQLWHPACFASARGRRALYLAFARGLRDSGGASRPGKKRDALVRARNVTRVVSAGPWALLAMCSMCGNPIEPDGPALAEERGRRSDAWIWVPVLNERRPSSGELAHPACFIDSRGRGAAYRALSRDMWGRVGPIIKRLPGSGN